MLIAGKIYFACVPCGREIEDFVAFLTRCAEENRIWINTGGHIRNPDARYKYSINNSESNDFAEKYLPFEITDAKDADECNRIISGISYRDTDFSIADWGSSGIPNIESFLVQIIEHVLIESVQIAIDLMHGYMPSECANIDITANEFCRTLTALPNHNVLPTAQFNIKKQRKE
jgi:hypothetical protein